MTRLQFLLDDLREEVGSRKPSSDLSKITPDSVLATMKRAARDSDQYPDERWMLAREVARWILGNNHPDQEKGTKLAGKILGQLLTQLLRDPSADYRLKKLTRTNQRLGPPGVRWGCFKRGERGFPEDD